MEDGVNDLERVLARRVPADRNAATVVLDDDDAVGADGDEDLCRLAGHRLVDRVVDDLPHKVVEAAAVGRADVHAGTATNGFETLEDLDARRRVVRTGLGAPACRVPGWSVSAGWWLPRSRGPSGQAIVESPEFFLAVVLDDDAASPARSGQADLRARGRGAGLPRHARGPDPGTALGEMPVRVSAREAAERAPRSGARTGPGRSPNRGRDPGARSADRRVRVHGPRVSRPSATADWVAGARSSNRRVFVTVERARPTRVARSSWVKPELLDELSVCVCGLDRVEVVSLEVLDEREFQLFAVGELADDRRGCGRDLRPPRRGGAARRRRADSRRWSRSRGSAG